MMRTVYLNGEYLPENEAKVSVFDRGFTFSDSVYEVTSVIDGKLIDFDGHMQRLKRSLRELDFGYVPDIDDFLEIHREMITRNNVDQGMVYLQITRGVPPDRSFHYEIDPVPIPTIFIMTQNGNLVESPAAERGIRAISIPDLRWGRCDIKTTQLLYQSLGKVQAKKAGVDDAWMVDETSGYITEGTSNNVWIIKDKTFITRHATSEILSGITRKTVMRLIGENDFSLMERPFTVAEAQEADEAFYTSSSSFVMPVVELDGKHIGTGKPGPLTRRLRTIYIEESRKAAI